MRKGSSSSPRPAAGLPPLALRPRFPCLTVARAEPLERVLNGALAVEVEGHNAMLRGLVLSKRLRHTLEQRPDLRQLLPARLPSYGCDERRQSRVHGGSRLALHLRRLLAFLQSHAQGHLGDLAQEAALLLVLVLVGAGGEGCATATTEPWPSRGGRRRAGSQTRRHVLNLRHEPVVLVLVLVLVLIQVVLVLQVLSSSTMFIVPDSIIVVIIIRVREHGRRRGVVLGEHLLQQGARAAEEPRGLVACVVSDVSVVVVRRLLPRRGLASHPRRPFALARACLRERRAVFPHCAVPSSATRCTRRR
eukprot:scaffold7946_cov403-Prasinococcus_capsulatus_cf.AAC.4